jgi:hypothetical protein
MIYGPFAFGSFNGTDVYVLCPLLASKDLIIQEVSIWASVVAGAACVLSLAKSTINATTKVETAPTGALAATSANRVSQGRVLDATGITARRVERLPLTNGYTTLKATAAGTVPGDAVYAGPPAGGYNNIIEAGCQLYLHGSINATSGLANLYVKVRWTERKN